MEHMILFIFQNREHQFDCWILQGYTLLDTGVFLFPNTKTESKGYYSNPLVLHSVELCDELGIKHKFSIKYTLQWNGLVEKRIEHWLICQGPCLVNMVWVIHLLWRHSTRLAMHQIDSIVTSYWRRHHMSYWLEESPTFHTLECLIANVIFSRKAQD